MASTAAAGKSASSITFGVGSLAASVAFSAPLFDAGRAATGTAASHAEASRFAFSISVFHGFDGTENHDSLGAFFSGSTGFASGALPTTASVEDCSWLFTRANSSTVAAVSVELTAAQASGASGVVEIGPTSAVASGMLAGTGGASVTRLLAAGAVSTSSGFSSAGSHDTP